MSLYVPKYALLDKSINVSTAFFIDQSITFALVVHQAGLVRPDDKARIEIALQYSSVPCPKGYLYLQKCKPCAIGEATPLAIHAGAQP